MGAMYIAKPSTYGAEEGEVLVNVKNHYPLVDHLKEYGIPLGELEHINYFNYWAMPHLPHGKILINENDWLLAPYDTDFGPYPQITLILEGKYGTSPVVFENLLVTKVSYIQGPITEPSVSLRPGAGRLLVLDLQSKMPPFGEEGYFSDTLEGIFSGIGMSMIDREYLLKSGILTELLQYVPTMQNYLNILEIVADSHFMTIAVKARTGASYSLSVDSLGVSNSSASLPTDNNSLLRSQVSGIDVTNFTFDVKMLYAYPNISRYLTADTFTPTAPGSYMHSAFEDACLLQDPTLVYPFLINNGSTGFTIAVDTLIPIIKVLSGYRLKYEADLLFKDILPFDPSIVFQKVTYSLERFGLATRLQSVPWKGHLTDKLGSKSCTERIETFALNTNMVGGVGLASFGALSIPDYSSPMTYDGETVSNPYHGEASAGLLLDPQGIFSSLKAGSTGLSILTCDGKHYVIQAGCNQTEVTPVDPTGACVYYIQGSSEPGCFITTAAVCNALPASYSATYMGNGSTC